MGSIFLQGQFLLFGGEVNFGYTKSIEQWSPFEDGPGYNVGNLDSVLLWFQILCTISISTDWNQYKKIESSVAESQGDIFVFGGFDHKRNSNFGRNKTLIYKNDNFNEITETISMSNRRR